MFFGELPLDEAEGAILAHSQEAGERTLKKGTVLRADDLAELRAAGHSGVVVARLDPGDLDENSAAARVAAACAGGGLRPGPAATGRVNLFADRDGLLAYNRAALARLNAVDEAITLAALGPCDRVGADQIAATVKIIPFGVAEAALARLESHLAGQALLSVAPFQPRRAALIQTRLPGTRDKVLAKTRETVSDRLAALGSTLALDRVVAHDTDAVAQTLRAARESGCDLLLLFGASATTDRRDTLPAAIAAAGGKVHRFGIPADPGNLLVLGALAGAPVLALPGSARSPRLGGNDWVLWRLCADLPVSDAELAELGAGGLLKDTPARPLPRAEAAPERPRPPRPRWRVAAVVLAAGQSRRMGAADKMTLPLGGKPLVAHAVAAARAAGADPILVVGGANVAALATALADQPVRIVPNPEAAEGLGSSLRVAAETLTGTDLDALLVMLGDMPAVRPATLRALIAAFDPAGGLTLAAPVKDGRRGHPVLFARRFLPELASLAGDVGARGILSQFSDQMARVPSDDPGIFIDLDTPDDMAAYSKALE